jgi:hypothetical protein
MMVSLRLKDDLVAEIDRVAAAQGQSRSAWMALALMRAALHPANDSLPFPGAGEGDDPDEPVRVTVRLARSEIEAIDKVGAPLGLSRNQWIKRVLRWQLWDKAGELRLAKVTQDEIGKLRKQVTKISSNINQAVTAMNAANRPESRVDIARIAEPFVETCTDLRKLLFGVQRSLTTYVGGEVSYWTSAFAEPER